MAPPVPVHVLAGDDELLLQRALERLLAQLRADRPDTHVEQVDGSQLAGLPELRTASLFGGTRAVVVRDADRLSGGALDEVLAYLEAPDTGSVLVLVAESTDRRQRLFKRAQATGARIEMVRAPRPWDQRAWEQLVETELRRLDRDPDPAAVAAILAHAGTDAATIASKCAQVAAATPPSGRISPAQVEAVVEGHGNRGAFPVADAVADRDPAAAILALRGALDGGEQPLAVLGAIAFRLRQLLQVRGGASPDEAGVSPAHHRHLLRSARRFSPGELPWCHDRLCRADLDLKGSDLPGDLTLEIAVIELATPRLG